LTKSANIAGGGGASPASPTAPAIYHMR